MPPDLLAIQLFNTLIGPITAALVVAAIIAGVRYLRAIMVKVSKIAAYLFTPATGADGIPGAPGKIDLIDAQIDLLRKGQKDFYSILDTHGEKLDALMTRTETSNGRTIGRLAEDTAHKVEE